jgi:hypothetical protein
MSGSVLLNVFGQIDRVTFRAQALNGICCMKSVYFWGVPDKVVVDISTQTKVTKLDFKVTEPLEPTLQPQYSTSLPTLAR